YAAHGHSLVGIGDPLGPRERWADLIWDLRDLADRRGDRVVFFDTASEAMTIYLDLGLQAMRLGLRSYLSLPEVDPATWLAAAAPGAALPAAGGDLAVTICQGEETDRMMSEIAAISDAWLEAHRLRERHVIRGHFSRDYVARCPVAILRHHGSIRAFAVLWRGAGRGECEIDLLRWSPEAPAGAPQQLLAGILAWAKAERIRRLSLGLQPAIDETDPRIIAFWHAVQPGAEQHLAPAALISDGQQDLPLSSEASYLFHPLGELAQSLRDLTDLVIGPRSAV
ncbi:MAG TPA: phosphatidylglycerol lysyltransferase domain-containing protein, partial [Dongiaceae bacterium]|nr:phosphatidylglycerol lysyltransferase domain-containing protein [Dongiaceae bacterium]